MGYKFKKGDVVVRTADYDWKDDSGFMKKGRIYTVMEMERPTNMKLVGSYAGYDPAYFELANNEIVKKIIKDL